MSSSLQEKDKFLNFLAVAQRSLFLKCLSEINTHYFMFIVSKSFEKILIQVVIGLCWSS